MRHCSACGQGWLEANAVEIVDGAPKSTNLVPADLSHDLDREARRLAEAARQAGERHRERRRRRLASLRGWAILATACVVPLAGVIAFPESVTRAAPAAARIYSLAGIDVNVFGFVVREAASELQMQSGLPLLAVRGEVVNISDSPRTVPALRFVLRDGKGKETYAWTLDGVGSRSLEAGEATSFLTRIQAPPPSVQDVEISFARQD
ncbi:MAG TPA: FxLYD domain-containing protein [Aestuariivirgaceae bacterium]|nr:FxLYD domain-containing protein [Aestuariivirgaceae bacterium]